jgi:hypothetical protein
MGGLCDGKSASWVFGLGSYLEFHPTQGLPKNKWHFYCQWLYCFLLKKTSSTIDDVIKPDFLLKFGIGIVFALPAIA